MLYIRNEDIERAFLSMMNKLIFSRKLILQPLLEQMKAYSDDSGVIRQRELETEIMKISEQRQTLQRLMAQGYLDQIVFNEQKNDLMTRTLALQREIDALQGAGGAYQHQLLEVQKLLRFTERTAMLQEFDDEIFTEFANRVIVYNRTEVGFQLKCGLTLRERMD